MNYKIEAIDVLLNEDCILQRYFPLIQYKEMLIENLMNNHYFSKAECMELPDEILIEMGLPNHELVKLFRNFMVMYDVKDSKFKDIKDIVTNEVSNGKLLAEETACYFRRFLRSTAFYFR